MDVSTAKQLANQFNPLYGNEKGMRKREKKKAKSERGLRNERERGKVCGRKEEREKVGEER